MLATILILFCPVVGLAQNQDTEVKELRSQLRAERRGLVGDAMELEADEAAVFWPIYDRYEAELGKLSGTRIELIQRFAWSHGRLTEDLAKELAGEWFDLQRRRLKLKQKVFKRLEKAMSSIVAARFLQIEHQIELMMDLKISSDLPAILPGAPQ